MRPFCILLLLALARTVASAAMGILSSNEIATAEGVATSRLAILQASTSETNYAFLGFHSTNEIRQMALTNPIVVRTLSLNRLRNYHLGDDFGTLLEVEPWARVVFPVVVSTNVRSSLAFRFDRAANGVYSDLTFGQRKLIRELTSIHRLVSPAKVKSGEAPFAVEIPVFDIWLVGYLDTQDKLVLLATVDLHLGPMTIYRNEPVTQAAMLRLATVALRYNGLPN